MDRRSAVTWIVGIAGAGLAHGASEKRPADKAVQGDAHVHDHSAMTASSATPRKFEGLIVPFQACTRAAQECIAHCQELLAKGDKSLGECLRTALDTEAVCGTVLKLAGFNSRFSASLAKESVTVMQACVDACKEHVKHHVACKTCHDACLKAIEAAKQVA